MHWLASLMETVRWAEMTHCRGSAADIPATLQAAVAPTVTRARKRARRYLRDALCHQGSIFEPTAAAAPVFVAALDPKRDEDTIDWGIRWMHRLAAAYTMSEGQGLQWLLDRGALTGRKRQEAIAQYKREQQWVAQCHAAVWESRHRLLELVDNSNSERWVDAPRAVVLALRCSQDDAARVELAQALAARCRQRLDAAPSPRLHASDVAAIGALVRLVPGSSQRVLSAQLANSPSLSSSIAAIRLLDVGVHVEDAANAAAASLRCIDAHDAWLHRNDNFPWHRGLRFGLIAALCSLSDDLFFTYEELVVDVLRRHLNGYVYDALAAPVVGRVLGDFAVTADTRRKDLPARALPVLDAILHSDVWEELDDSLLGHGLLPERAFWARMLAT